MSTISYEVICNSKPANSANFNLGDSWKNCRFDTFDEALGHVEDWIFMAAINGKKTFPIPNDWMGEKHIYAAGSWIKIVFA